MKRHEWLDAVLASECSHRAVRVAAYLYRRADDALKCWPKQDTIAQEAGMSVRAVRRGIAELVDAGWVTSRRNDWGQNEYVLHRSEVTGAQVRSDLSDRSEVTGPTGQKCPVQQVRSDLSSKKPKNQPKNQPKKAGVEKPTGNYLRELVTEFGLGDWHQVQLEQIEAEWFLKDERGWKDAMREALVSLTHHQGKGAGYFVSAMRSKAQEHQPARATQTYTEDDYLKELQQWT